MQEESFRDVVTPNSTRKRRRRRGLRYSSRRELLRSRMVRKQARSAGVDLQGTVRTLSYPASKSTTTPRAERITEVVARAKGGQPVPLEVRVGDSIVSQSSPERNPGIPWEPIVS